MSIFHMMKKLILFFLLCSHSLMAQLETNLTAWFSFDKVGCAITDEYGDPNVQTFTNGDLSCVCGVSGNSLRFDGDDDWFYVFGLEIDKAFRTVDFSLSFYFKTTTSANKTMTLFNKMVDCGPDNSFNISYNTGTRTLFVNLSESNSITGSLSHVLPYSCWYHIVVVRRGGETILYVNGEEVRRVVSPGSQRVNLSNGEPLIVGHSDCLLSEDFQGFIDEIRLYSRALKREEVRALYLRPDQIATGLRIDGKKDTIIFKGNSVSISLTSTCATGFTWKPATGVDNPSSPTPLLTPDVTTTYVLQMEDQHCIISDSILVTVIDPTDVSCTDVLLPNAFTPNGDFLNDGFGISNPYVVGELISFEIYDRWGNVVFSTTDPLVKWDGTYRGDPVNPGVYLYKIHFRCEGKEDFKTGSVTVIR
ncbi:MAG: hypothetical protein KatS3mg029_0005 [Saprospiraceae bacterium]|nr:MAG: hypothetical protein KatS3mg029_0005 [Saprospiraceae bacterium]